MSCQQRFEGSFAPVEIFPENIPYNFAIAYCDLILEQLEEHTGAIKKEVRAMLRGDWAPEMFGIEEALSEVWATSPSGTMSPLLLTFSATLSVFS